MCRKAGSGTFVIYRQMSEEMEIIDIRSAIEPEIVRLAVANATLIDLEKLRCMLEQAETKKNDPAAFTRADTQFHLTLAECTRNPLIVWLY